MEIHGIATIIAPKSLEPDIYRMRATVQLVGELGCISSSYVIQTEKGMGSTHRRNEIPKIWRNPIPPKMRLLSQ
jgi:hypothetical protein